MNNLCSFIFETMQQVLVLLVKVWVKDDATFITVNTQIMTFSLNLGLSNKNFQTNKYSLERSFQKELEYQQKKKKSKFFRKTLRSNLYEISSETFWHP